MKKSRASLITKQTRSHTQGTCLSCEHVFNTYISEESSAEWEIRMLFQRHDCKQTTWQELLRPAQRHADRKKVSLKKSCSFYVCSLCREEGPLFNPNPFNQDSMSAAFNQHVAIVHPATLSDLRED